MKIELFLDEDVHSGLALDSGDTEYLRFRDVFRFERSKLA